MMFGKSTIWLGAMALCAGLLGGASAHADEAKRILVFGDSNSWGWKAKLEAFPVERFGDDERWAGVMAKALGEDYTVIVDGLSGRTTDLDFGQDLGALAAEDFNGAKDLPEVLAKNLPLDLVVVMLGTNDAQAQFDRNADQVAQGAMHLVDIVRNINGGVLTTYGTPKVLLVTPPPMGDISKTPLSANVAGGVEISRQFADAFDRAAKLANVPVFDAGSVIGTSGVDGIHFTAEEHAILGKAVAKQIQAGVLVN